MIVRRKEGEHTKKVRNKTDIGDVLLPTATGAASGAVVGKSIFGKPGIGAAIGAATSAVVPAAVVATRRIKDKNSKGSGGAPKKPIEIVTIPNDNNEKAKRAKKFGGAAAVATSSAAGAYLGSSSSGAARELVDEILKGKTKAAKKLNPEEVEIFKKWVELNEKVYGKLLGRLAVESEILKSPSLKKVINKRRVKSGVVGAIALGGLTAAGIASDRKKAKLLKEAYEKDKEEYLDKKSKK